MHDIFNALKYTSCSHVKAVILGQDPYHQPGQAHGLCFSVKKDVQPPPSLVNIFRECGINPAHGELTGWARQGVLLLNTVLTVRRNQANSHKGMGWEILTDKIIEILNNRGNIVFILWGANAKAKRALLTNEDNLVLTGAHPSPLSANRGGFFGGDYFSKTNAFLRERGINQINWQQKGEEL
jgi:uracil-DNA glycosylase